MQTVRPLCGSDNIYIFILNMCSVSVNTADYQDFWRKKFVIALIIVLPKCNTVAYRYRSTLVTKLHTVLMTVNVNTVRVNELGRNELALFVHISNL
jgi:hypothetical protein